MRLKKDGEPTTDFVQKCWMRDAEHFRQTYMNMISLVPQYESVIRDGASHRQILMSSKEELDVWIDEQYSHPVRASYMAHDKETYRGMLYKVCKFS